MPQNPTPASNIRSAHAAKFPIGVSNFAGLIEGGYTFVDKSLLIEDILQRGAAVTLITRPRRFGKTLNLSMLQHFFANRVIGRETRGLFDGLAIASRPAAMAHQGQYPVIFLTFKDLKGDSYEECVANFQSLLADLYRQYPELLESDRIDADRMQDLRAIRSKKANQTAMEGSLRLLSELLYQHHGKRVVILLDEYDSPLHNAYVQGYYSKLIRLMRQLLSAALKDNPYLHLAVVTGILRISKETIFSGLNNIDVQSVLDEGYRSAFGFTETEVSALLQLVSLADNDPSLEANIKAWYNGYRIGSGVLYNPWSIVSCLSRQGELAPYWANTAKNELLKRLIWKSKPAFKEDLERLMRREAIEQPIDPNLVFDELDGNSTALWSLLLFSGYLTAREIVRGVSKEVRCMLVVPNLEIGIEYRDIVEKWLIERLGSDNYHEIVQSLRKGDADKFGSKLRTFLLESMSFFDPRGRHPESVYHALLLGLMAAMEDSHTIESNRESGHGRYDIALTPRRAGGLGIVFELKAVKDRSKLKKTAQEALAQIRMNRYDTQMRQRGAKKCLAIGLGFCGKRIEVAHETLGSEQIAGANVSTAKKKVRKSTSINKRKK